jgi:hypothetical protein
MDAIARLQGHAGNCVGAHDARVQAIRYGVEGDTLALVARHSKSSGDSGVGTATVAITVAVTVSDTAIDRMDRIFKMYKKSGVP